jgi:tape measure domain-containing protein
MTAEVIIDIIGRDSASGSLGNLGNIITGIKSAVDLAGDAFRTFTGFAGEGLDAIANYERMSASLQSLTASQILQSGAVDDMATAMEMAAPKAEELLGWIQEIAIKSPFTSAGVAQAFRMAEAYGFSADESKRLVQALIDFTAGTGASEYAMQQIARALGQISATGRVTGGDMLQLVNAGLPVTQILADGFGVTTAKIMEMREKGLLPAKESIEMITTYLETNFQGAAERQANTWAGLKGTFEDLKTMGLREFFGGLFDVIQPLAVEFSSWLQTEGMDKLREWGAVLGEFTQNIVDKIPLVVAKLEELKAAFDAGGFTGVMQILANDLGAALTDAISNIDWIGITDSIDAALASAIRNHDWTASGQSFGAMLDGVLAGSIDSQDSTATPALVDAINNWLLGAVGAVSWDEWRASASAKIREFINGVVEDFKNWVIAKAWESHNAWVNFWMSALDITPISDWIRGIIDKVKNFLGISSPSTVFYDIGRNIVQGLINGWDSMFNAFQTVVKNALQGLLDATINPILSVLGLDTINLGGSSTGSVGGQAGSWGGGSTTGTGTPSTGAAGTVVNQYFAGATINVGSWDQISYECLSPNPFVGATSNQLVTGSVGGGQGTPH